MQPTCRPAPAGKSHLKPDFNVMTRRTNYLSAIATVAASLMGMGTGLQAQSAAPPAASASATDTAVPAPMVVPKVFKNELGFTADFMYGEGTITLPVGYSLAKALPGGNLPSQVITANRSTVYYGGTVSYSYGRSWFLDLSYEDGTSTGSQKFNFDNTLLDGLPGHQNAAFNYNDDWYQLYLRYNFQNWQWLTDKGFKSYLRGGVSLVDATLTASIPSYYSQTDDTKDILGNIGFGLTYTVYARPRFKLGLQVEGEGSFGERSQDSTEDLPQDANLSTSRASINNTLYGGIGRGTLHADWRVGHSGRWKLTGDLGVQAKFTKINYPNAGSSPDEYLWGPYVKIGASYVF